MKDIKKKLEERVPVKWRFGFKKMKGTKRPEGTIEEGTIFCANKDLLKAVLPLIEKVWSKWILYVYDHPRTKKEFPDFLEKLVEERFDEKFDEHFWEHWGIKEGMPYIKSFFHQELIRVLESLRMDIEKYHCGKHKRLLKKIDQLKIK